MIPSVAWHYWRLIDPFCSEHGSDGCSEDCQCFWMARTTPKTARSPWDFVTLPVEDRVTSIGNMHRKIGKGRACGSGDILADRQTDTHTHHNTSPPLPRCYGLQATFKCPPLGTHACKRAVFCASDQWPHCHADRKNTTSQSVVSSHSFCHVCRYMLWIYYSVRYRLCTNAYDMSCIRDETRSRSS